MSDLNIPDNNLYRAFVYAAGEPVTEEKLKGITELNWNEYMAESDPASWDPVHDLTGIEHCKKLKKLSFDGNNVKSLAPLSACTELEELWLVGNSVSDLTPLKDKVKLKKLVLDTCSTLSDLNPVKQLPELAYINISHTQVSDVTPLLSLPALKTVSMFNLKNLDISQGTENRKVLLELIQKGVQIQMPGIEILVKEALELMGTDAGSDELIPFLKSHSAFKAARLIEEKGIKGTYTHDKLDKDKQNNSVLHLVLEPYFLAYRDEIPDLKPVVERLIKEGAPVNHQNEWKSTPLLYYLKNNRKADIGIVKLLVTSGADVNAVNSSKDTPLKRAEKNGHKDIAEYLKENGAIST